MIESASTQNMIESADIIQKVMLVAIFAIAFTVLITMRRKL